MDKHRYGLALIFFSVIFFGLLSFLSCVAAEIKRTKKEDLKLDGKLCYLPASRAVEFGIAALICLIVAQIAGNLVIWVRKFCSAEKGSNPKARKRTIPTALLVLSWMSFWTSVILLSTATSMNKRQPYGKGWLDGECYIVKDGLYIAAAGLVLITIGSTLSSAIITLKKSKVEEGCKIHAQSASG